MTKRDYGWLVSLPFFGVHAAAIIGVALLGWSWKWFGIAMALYYVRMFGVTGGYHRYFSHRTYRTGRAFQLFLAVLAQTSIQKGALWWAAHHRDHHKFSDTKQDPHSWREYGFWYSHIGWIVSRRTEDTHWKNIKDLERYPELRWLNTWHAVPGLVMAILCYVVGGMHGLVWGFFVSTTLLWHGTFTINSLSHWWGGRRYDTADDSKNNFVLALVTMGEGWHNNHHYYPRSTAQGFLWWQVDPTLYILKGLSKVGLVWDLQLPPQAVLDGTLVAPREKGKVTTLPVALVSSPSSVAVTEAAAE